MTLRPLNGCQDCGYEWYPRGRNISLKCPNQECRSRNVVMFEEYWVEEENNSGDISLKEKLVAVAVLAIIVWFFNKDSSFLVASIILLMIAAAIKWPLTSAVTAAGVASLVGLLWLTWKTAELVIAGINWIVTTIGAIIRFTYHAIVFCIQAATGFISSHLMLSTALLIFIIVFFLGVKWILEYSEE